MVTHTPLKLIKCGIKVFCLCCSVTIVSLEFEVYLRREFSLEDLSALGIANRFIAEAGLTQAKGYTLHTDNWCTSIPLAVFLHKNHRQLFARITVPTEKKDRKVDDPPFLKLLIGALKSAKRCWFCEATVKKKTKHSSKHKMQCSVWHNKKQVTFIHAECVSLSNRNAVKRYHKGKVGGVEIESPLMQNKTC